MKVYSSITLITDDEKLIATALRVKSSENINIDFLSSDEVDCIPEGTEMVIVDDFLVDKIDVSCPVVIRARDKNLVERLVELGYQDFLFSSVGDVQFLVACLKRGLPSNRASVGEELTIGVLRVNTETWCATLRGEAIHLPKSAISYIKHVFIEGQKPTTTDRVARCRLKKRFGEDLLNPTPEGAKNAEDRVVEV